MTEDTKILDLLTRIVRQLDEVAGDGEVADALEVARADCDARHLLGEDLWNEVCHAIGWDIDWDSIRETNP